MDDMFGHAALWQRGGIIKPLDIKMLKYEETNSKVDNGLKFVKIAAFLQFLYWRL